MNIVQYTPKHIVLKSIHTMEKIHNALPTLEQSQLFERVEGYTLEIFSSLAELESGMETVRASRPTEASGFVQEKGSEFGFYYKVSDRETSSELPDGLNNSWHSHPDTVSHEAIIDAENIPDELSEDLRQLASDVLSSYKNVDETTPTKPSLIDLINIVDHQREIDRISLPGCLLEIRIREMHPDTDITLFGQKLNTHWNELVQQIRERITNETTENEVTIYRFEMALKHYKFAITCFSEILISNGFSRMDENNWFSFLQTIGVPIIQKNLENKFNYKL